MLATKKPPGEARSAAILRSASLVKPSMVSLYIVGLGSLEVGCCMVDRFADDDERGRGEARAPYRFRKAGERREHRALVLGCAVLHDDAGGLQCGELFATAAEDERIATLEARDGLASTREPDHQPLDEALRRGKAAAALADVDDTAASELEAALVDQLVDQHHARLAKRTHRGERHQLRITRPRSDEIHASAWH